MCSVQPATTQPTAAQPSTTSQVHSGTGRLRDTAKDY